MGSLGIGIIALVLTVVFLLAFAVVAVNRWGEKISWLKHHGTPVVATVTSVESLQRRGIR
jgi:hypothetical protein